MLIFARESNAERSFYFLGPATYLSHTDDRPIAINWRLAYELPGDLLATFAAAC